jgi:AcrR family transcriptional regulator
MRAGTRDAQEIAMARRPETPGTPEKSDREKIVESFMALLSERRYEDIGFGDVATRSGVPLHRCRAEFDSLIAVLAAHLREIDRKVLEGGDADMAQEPPRERLFDVLMRRLEALAPHKAAVRSLTRSARCNPPLALALNAMTARSQSWMLTAAGIDSSGIRGAIRAQGMACLYADVLRTWLDDEDPGLARTMATLDRQLARGARWSRGLDDLCRLVPNPCRPRRDRYRDDRDRRADDPGEQPAVV